jgi:single-strand DNA-binding protein
MKTITVMGRLYADAELRNTNNGTEVCGFRMAVDDRRTKETYSFGVSYWGKAGAAVAPYLKKGTQVCVSGDFSWREYNGSKYLEINAQSLTLAGSKPQAQNSDFIHHTPVDDTLKEALGISNETTEYDDAIPF